jgi:hypothetical protein
VVVHEIVRIWLLAWLALILGGLFEVSFTSIAAVRRLRNVPWVLLGVSFSPSR